MALAIVTWQLLICITNFLRESRPNTTNRDNSYSTNIFVPTLMLFFGGQKTLLRTVTFVMWGRKYPFQHLRKSFMLGRHIPCRRLQCVCYGAQSPGGRQGLAEQALGEAAAEGLAKLVLHRTPLSRHSRQPGAPADALEEPVVVQVH